jgi:hypothetical protein
MHGRARDEVRRVFIPSVAGLRLSNEEMRHVRGDFRVDAARIAIFIYVVSVCMNE